MRTRRRWSFPILLDAISYAAACVLASAVVPYLEHLFRSTYASPRPVEVLPIWVLCFVLLVPILFLWDGYSLPRHWDRVRTLRSLTVAHAAFLAAYLFLTIPFPSMAAARKMILATSFFSVLALWYCRLVCPDLYGRMDRKRRALLVGAHTYAIRALQRFARDHAEEFEILGVIDDFKQGFHFQNLHVEHCGGQANLRTILRTRPVDTILVLTDQARYADAIIDVLSDHPNVREVYARVQIPLSVAQDIELTFAQEVPLLKVYSSSRNRWLEGVRGAFDRIVALTGLVILSPIFAITAILIKLDSRGPVFYRQSRLGLGNRPFRIWKFRSMVVDAEKGSGAVLAQKNDARATRVGRWLRMSRVDELPQLINVLVGDMSLIGPRPERPEFQNTYREAIPWYPLRSLCKPGITGLAQVTGDYHTSAQRKLLYDVTYLANMGFLFDLRILAATALTVLTRKGH